MKIPATPHVRPLALTNLFTHKRSDFSGNLRPPSGYREALNRQIYRGMEFLCGERNKYDVILLDQDTVVMELAHLTASYLLFVHAVEDRATNYQPGFADDAIDGNELGQHVSDYQLVYADGGSVSVPIRRRFEIQQSRTRWGASPFAAVPARADQISPSLGEMLETLTPEAALEMEGAGKRAYSWSYVRHTSGRDLNSEHLWLYALPNPHPEKPIRQLRMMPREERSLIYAISHTELREHPLRAQVRRKLRVQLPPEMTLNGIEELDQVGIDLGEVISARAVLDYDQTLWQGDAPEIQPVANAQAVIIEYAAHPQAALYLGSGDDQRAIALNQPDDAIEYIGSADRPVRLRIVEKGSSVPVAVRLHMHGQNGEYLPPRGSHRQVDANWFEDNYGEFVNGRNQYAYISGECVADLPLGTVFIEITRGYEITPIRAQFEVRPETDEVTFALDRVLDWRERGWVTADTHVHFISPQTALLEGAAEGVNVVNLLASQWGELFSNVSDFDGRTTLGARDFGGEGEFLVRVGTENRMQVLGHISLLGYSGAMIHPLCTGGPSESALGDPQEVTMAEWAQRCLDQQGLVVMPHGPNPQCERAADIVLGLVDAMEMMTFNPYEAQISPYGIADWYRYLNLGYQIPVVGGSDKMDAASLLGGVRTYAHMGEHAFEYESWMAAVRAGNTFVTVGPLIEWSLEGQVAGSQIELPAGGGKLNLSWRVASVRVPIEQVEVVVGGLVADQVNVNGKLSITGSSEVDIRQSTWVALRVRGSYQGETADIAAHTSAVQVIVGSRPLFSAPDGIAVLEQIEGAMAYVDTLAARPDVRRFKQLRATLEGAYNQLHQRLHRAGVFHGHSPLHQHEGPHGESEQR